MRVASRSEALIGAIVLCAAVALLSHKWPRHASAQEWQHYRNGRWGFCLDYPPGWKIHESFDGSGVTLSLKYTYITIGALPNQRRNVGNPGAVNDTSPPMNLQQNFRYWLNALSEFEHAKDVRVEKRRVIRFQHHPALLTLVRYTRHSRGSDLTLEEKTIWVILRGNGVLFTASLKCKPDELPSLGRMFHEVTFDRLRLNCP